VSRVTSSSRYISRLEREPLDRSMILLSDGATAGVSISSCSILMIGISGVGEREPEILITGEVEDMFLVGREKKGEEKKHINVEGKAENAE
jgi:hypothetical protein